MAKLTQQKCQASALVAQSWRRSQQSVGHKNMLKNKQMFGIIAIGIMVMIIFLVPPTVIHIY
jgi:uncharacterized membrane protein YidH (DUF202 family)